MKSYLPVWLIFIVLFIAICSFGYNALKVSLPVASNPTKFKTPSAFSPIPAPPDTGCSPCLVIPGRGSINVSKFTPGSTVFSLAGWKGILEDSNRLLITNIYHRPEGEMYPFDDYFEIKSPPGKTFIVDVGNGLQAEMDGACDFFFIPNSMSKDSTKLLAKLTSGSVYFMIIPAFILETPYAKISAISRAAEYADHCFKISCLDDKQQVFVKSYTSELMLSAANAHERIGLGSRVLFTLPTREVIKDYFTEDPPKAKGDLYITLDNMKLQEVMAEIVKWFKLKGFVINGVDKAYPRTFASGEIFKGDLKSTMWALHTMDSAGINVLLRNDTLFLYDKPFRKGMLTGRYMTVQ